MSYAHRPQPWDAKSVRDGLYPISVSSATGAPL